MWWQFSDSVRGGLLLSQRGPRIPPESASQPLPILQPIEILWAFLTNVIPTIRK